MKIDRLSPSSYNSWGGCQQKYFLEQVLKYSYPPGKAADKGTAAHQVMEILALAKLNVQNGGDNTFVYKDLEVDCSNPNVDEVIDFAIGRYKPGYFFPAEQKEIKQCVYNGLNFNNGEYNPLNRNIIAPEERVKVEVEKDWAVIEDGKRFYLSGIIDLVTKIDDSTYEIVDWKAGQAKDFYTGAAKTYSTLLDDPQLRFYHWAATKLYGDHIKFILSIFYIKEIKCFSIPFSIDDLEKTEFLLKDRFLEIKDCSFPSRNISWQCKKFCPFGKQTPHNTNLPILTQEEYGGIAKIGEPMTICDSTHHVIKQFGIDWVQENCAKGIKK